jgi:hypothetical protein
MKRILILTALGTTFALMAPMQALAWSQMKAWYCFASSPSASGWATGSLNAARSAALAQCAVRTPRNQTCYIRYCR